MNKKQFLSRLDKELKKFENKEKESILEFYSNFIEDAIDQNTTEEKVIEKLGSIDKIVGKIKSEYHIKKLDEEPKIGNLIMAIISLFKRIPFIESFKTSISVITKLLGFSIITIILYIALIIVFLVGTTLSLTFLYSSVIVQDNMFSTSNVFIIMLSTLLLLALAPLASFLAIWIISKIIIIFINIFKKSKEKVERVLMVFDSIIIVPLITIGYYFLVNRLLWNLSGSLAYIEAISFIVIGITGVIIYMILKFSEKISSKISISLKKILIKVEGDKI